MPAEPTAISVRTLLCHRDVPLMLRCWPTLIACSRDPVDTVIHDDGSLTGADETALKSAIPRCRILQRTVADEIMSERLRSLRHAAAFRASSVWGLKLLDVVLAEPGDCFYVDADIRFFRPFTGLFCGEAVSRGPVFLRDKVWTAYSIRPWHLLDRRHLRVSAAINTGLTLIARRDYDIDFIDWFLAQPDWRAIPAWIEPTCWAALAVRTQGRAIDPAQLPNLYPGVRLGPESIGAHFLSAYRGRFELELAAPIAADAPVQTFRFCSLGRTGPVALAANQLKRKLGNEWIRLTR
jgi:hypothetical protein